MTGAASIAVLFLSMVVNSTRAVRDERKTARSCCCKAELGDCAESDETSAVDIDNRCCMPAEECAGLFNTSLTSQLHSTACELQKAKCPKNRRVKETSVSKTGRKQKCVYVCGRIYKFFDPEQQCEKCLEGRDLAQKCEACLEGRDPAQDCRTCLVGHYFDPEASDPKTATCKRCKKVGLDPGANCAHCFEGMDEGCSRCTKPGFDPVAYPPCSTCSLGRNAAQHCTQCSFGYDPREDCRWCLPGFDPAADCRRCEQGRDIDTDCKQCLPGFELSGDGTCAVLNRSSWTLHIIGDTHGDENFLFHSLLSTGLFQLGGDFGIKWKDDVEGTNDFEVVILGDIVDRGARSRKNLRTLKFLASNDKFGRMHILLGNHESMILQHDLKDAGHENQAWLLAHRGHEDNDLLSWLGQLPTVRLSHGVLMTHGGLSGKVMERLGNDLTPSCHTPGAVCGKAVVDHLNHEAKAYFARLRKCMQQRLLNGIEDHTKCAFDNNADVLNPGSVVDALDGVLWYRGYSRSPKSENCEEARQVSTRLGADTMAVAHTTHGTIQRYCADAVPVFVTDTHTEDCMQTGECDFESDKKYHTDGSINPDRREVPQSLSITIVGVNRTKMFAKCFSMLGTDGLVTRNCWEF
eukprot:CAMPEP_0172712792 /NCGR_PEP_ID=MMETSP1074-20121228/61304_1 /TAXON_ID=2916 /ORGANISM="Ceratium fusus, Strain PA161109" /LENGTH=632 /DNA_ID=CAMNT_0013536771 /DNA_START=52 /DNA_END=1950 /DNA_ORIENTATION=+